MCTKLLDILRYSNVENSSISALVLLVGHSACHNNLSEGYFCVKQKTKCHKWDDWSAIEARCDAAR